MHACKKSTLQNSQKATDETTVIHPIIPARTSLPTSVCFARSKNGSFKVLRLLLGDVFPTIKRPLAVELARHDTKSAILVIRCPTSWQLLRCKS